MRRTTLGLLALALLAGASQPALAAPLWGSQVSVNAFRFTGDQWDYCGQTGVVQVVTQSCTAGSYSSPPPTGWNAIDAGGRASTSLATGDLRITGSKDIPPDALSLSASMQDVLYFSGALPGDQATMRMTVDGTQSGDVEAKMSFEFHPCYVDSSGISCPKEVYFAPVVLAPGSQFIEHTFNIGDGPVFVSFALSGGVRANKAGALDYDDPITIELPKGVTFTSESGQFLNDRPAAPVPEPATLALLGLGLAGLGASRRRR